MGPKAWRQNSIYSGGYNPEAAERVNSVPLPDKIKCGQCHRHFMSAKYSSKQLVDYKQRLLHAPTGAQPPRCRQCVGGPANELTCHRCDLTKGLDAFTKAQRRKPDIAHCKDCQQEVDDVEPNVEDALHEQEILETQTTIGSHSLYNYESVRGSLPALNSGTGKSDDRSVSTSSAKSTSDMMHFGAQASVAVDTEHGVWTGQNRKDGKENDITENDLPRRQAPSVGSSVVSMGPTGTAWDKVAPTGRPAQSYRSRLDSTRTNTTEQSKQSGNWAKQGAIKPDRGALREAEKQREAQRKVQEQERARYEEEESSGSDWEL